jgi:hypothetical protein
MALGRGRGVLLSQTWWTQRKYEESFLKLRKETAWRMRGNSFKMILHNVEAFLFPLCKEVQRFQPWPSAIQPTLNDMNVSKGLLVKPISYLPSQFSKHFHLGNLT